MWSLFWPVRECGERARTCSALGLYAGSSRRSAQCCTHLCQHPFARSHVKNNKQTNEQVHNISDILGGFLVAVIFTTPFAVKAIGLHTCIRQIIDDSSSSPVLPVAAVHDGGDGVVVNNGATATAPAAAAAKRGGHHHHELGHGGRGNDSHMVNLPPAGTSAV